MIMQRTGTGVNPKIYDKIIDDNKFKDEDGFIPPEILCCCEYQRADNEQGIHIAQHCMECSEVDSIIEGIICQCKLDPNRCFNAIQSKSLFPFPVRTASLRWYHFSCRRVCDPPDPCSCATLSMLKIVVNNNYDE